MINHRFILTVALLCCYSIYSSSSSAETPVYSTDGIAIAGYDVVSYFLEQQAILGQPEHSYRWQGVDWHFSSSHHRDLFVRSPESYQPLFGGFCALGVAHGALVPSVPTAWTVHNDQLIFNQNRAVTETWRYNPEVNIQRAQSNYHNAIVRYQQWQANTLAPSVKSGGQEQ